MWSFILTFLPSHKLLLYCKGRTLLFQVAQLIVNVDRVHPDTAGQLVLNQSDLPNTCVKKSEKMCVPIQFLLDKKEEI